VGRQLCQHVLAPLVPEHGAVDVVAATTSAACSATEAAPPSISSTSSQMWLTMELMVREGKKPLTTTVSLPRSSFSWKSCSRDFLEPRP